MPETTTHTMAVYSTDHLHLARDLHVGQLIVHLGDPGPAIDLRGHSLAYDEIELIGDGCFRLLRDGVQVQSIERRR